MAFNINNFYAKGLVYPGPNSRPRPSQEQIDWEHANNIKWQEHDWRDLEKRFKEQKEK